MKPHMNTLMVFFLSERCQNMQIFNQKCNLHRILSIEYWGDYKTWQVPQIEPAAKPLGHQGKRINWNFYGGRSQPGSPDLWESSFGSNSKTRKFGSNKLCESGAAREKYVRWAPARKAPWFCMHQSSWSQPWGERGPGFTSWLPRRGLGRQGDWCTTRTSVMLLANKADDEVVSGGEGDSQQTQL